VSRLGRSWPLRLVLLVPMAAGALAGCGFGVQSADLFLLHRQGGGRPLTLLVGDGGTVSCNGAAAKPISDALLIAARDLAVDLDKDAKARLRLPPRAGSVYSFTIKLQDGTVAFADTGAAAHRELARAELFAVQTAQQVCGLPG